MLHEIFQMTEIFQDLKKKKKKLNDQKIMGRFSGVDRYIIGWLNI